VWAETYQHPGVENHRERVEFTNKFKINVELISKEFKALKNLRGLDNTTSTGIID
jgi:hypothetical protein